MNYQINVEGKVAVVTGAARGIGHEIAMAFLSRGAKVGIADISVEEGDNSWVGEHAERALCIKCDVTEEASVERMISRVVAKFGTVDILINNAGIMYKDMIDEINLAKWNQLMAINMTGPMLCAKKAVPLMKRQSWGRIVNISSMIAIVGAETYSAYGAAKAALSQLTKDWAAELASFGITVNAICPGWTYTPMVLGFIERIATLQKTDLKGALERILNLIPQRRFIEPAEIAFTALFLASELAKGINATGIVLDTGQTSMLPLGLGAQLPSRYEDLNDEIASLISRMKAGQT